MRRGRGTPLGTFLGAGLAAALVLTAYRPPDRPLLDPPFRAAPGRPALPFAEPAPSAYGVSGGVKMRFVLPGRVVDYPLAIASDSGQFAYQWVRVVDTVPAGIVRPLGDERLLAPEMPGFYRLALLRGGERRLVDGLTVTVLIPFGEKEGATLRGVRLGMWAGERGGRRARASLPEGFIQVADAALQLPISKHLRLGDFLTTPDTPTDGMPDFAALDPRLLDKLELVMGELQRSLSAGGGVAAPRLLVNSGFRPPVYNRTVRGAASDSRHQYGDAADVRIDLDGDGRFSQAEARRVVKAVNAVERSHPDLAGGLGLYTSRRYRSPYVHIDARGSRARWTG